MFCYSVELPYGKKVYYGLTKRKKMDIFIFAAQVFDGEIYIHPDYKFYFDNIRQEKGRVPQAILRELVPPHDNHEAFIERLIKGAKSKNISLNEDNPMELIKQADGVDVARQDQKLYQQFCLNSKIDGQDELDRYYYCSHRC